MLKNKALALDGGQPRVPIISLKKYHQNYILNSIHKIEDKMNREKYTEKCTKAVVKQIAAADRISKKQARDRFTSSRTYHFLATDPGVTTKEAPENFF